MQQRIELKHHCVCDVGCCSQWCEPVSAEMSLSRDRKEIRKGALANARKVLWDAQTMGITPFANCTSCTGWRFLPQAPSACHCSPGQPHCLAAGMPESLTR